MSDTEPSPSWVVTRTATFPRARAVAGPGATVESLALQLGLDPHQFRHWVRFKSDHADLSATDPVREGEVVEVPNAVFVLWVGELGWFGRAFVRRSSDEVYLQERGFFVVKHDAAEVSAPEWLRAVGQASEAAELHGLFVTGHGLPGGFGGTAWDRWSVEYRQLVGDGVEPGRLRYGLGLVIINACLSDYCRADTCFREPSRLLFGRGPFWRSRPTPEGTTIPAGGRDLVARSPASRFFGVKGILNPVVTTCHAWDLIRPGDQGTRGAFG